MLQSLFHELSALTAYNEHIRRFTRPDQHGWGLTTLQETDADLQAYRFTSAEAIQTYSTPTCFIHSTLHASRACTTDISSQALYLHIW